MITVVGLFFKETLLTLQYFHDIGFYKGRQSQGLGLQYFAEEAHPLFCPNNSVPSIGK